MKEILKYRIIEGSSEEGLCIFEQNVMNYLEKGWELVGGISASYSGYRDMISYHQTIVKYKEELASEEKI